MGQPGPDFLPGVIHMNGRVYDPQLGRMLQADPFIQAPGNTQSYNRYSYVLNNPLGYTDPSGYFFKKLFQNQVFKVVAAVGLAAMTYGAVSAWAATAFSTTTTGVASASVAGGAFGGGAVAASVTTSFSITTLSTGGAVASGAIAGASAGAVSGAVLSGNMNGVAKGAFTGAVFGGIGGGFGSSWSAERIATTSFAGGITAEVNGQKFADGFKLALVSSLAQTYYYKSLGYEADFVKGENDGPNRYEEAFGVPKSLNTFGTNVKLDSINGKWYSEIWKQQSWFSKAANEVPGLQAVSKLHDYYQIALGSGDSLFRIWGNVPAMAPAAGITYSALATNPAMAAAFNGYE